MLVFFSLGITQRSGGNMFAIIQSGGKQYRVSQGDVVKLELLSAEVGQVVDLPVVLLGGDTIQIGKPFVKGATVKAEVVEQGKHKKLYGYKYRAKTNYRRKYGHRQPYTAVKIQSIA
jgi:large subunit ribosomal protein L21